MVTSIHKDNTHSLSLFLSRGWEKEVATIELSFYVWFAVMAAKQD